MSKKPTDGKNFRDSKTGRFVSQPEKTSATSVRGRNPKAVSDTIKPPPKPKG